MLQVSIVRMVCVALFGLLAFGSGVQGPAQRITRSFERLQHAAEVRDGQALCELIFPFGRDLSSVELQRTIAQDDSPRGRAKFAAYVRHCATDTKDHPGIFTQWHHVLRGLRVGKVVIDGNLATARMRSPTRRLTLKFVKVAGDWRLLFRFA